MITQITQAARHKREQAIIRAVRNIQEQAIIQPLLAHTMKRFKSSPAISMEIARTKLYSFNVIL